MGAGAPDLEGFLRAARERLDALVRGEGAFEDPFGFFEEFDALDVEPGAPRFPASGLIPFPLMPLGEDEDPEDVALFLQSGQDFEL